MEKAVSKLLVGLGRVIENLQWLAYFSWVNIHPVPCLIAPHVWVDFFLGPQPPTLLFPQPHAAFTRRRGIQPAQAGMVEPTLFIGYKITKPV